MYGPTGDAVHAEYAIKAVDQYPGTFSRTAHMGPGGDSSHAVPPWLDSRTMTLARRWVPW